MTSFKASLRLFLCLSFVSIAHATTIFTSVPFENISLVPNQIIKANYAFGPHAIIFCFENTLQTIGNITWPFNNQIRSASLPVTLVTNSNFDGFFANVNGVITITNTSKAPIIVSCDFGY